MLNAIRKSYKIKVNFNKRDRLCERALNDKIREIERERERGTKVKKFVPFSLLRAS